MTDDDMRSGEASEDIITTPLPVQVNDKMGKEQGTLFWDFHHLQGDIT